jgi:F420-dependent oxidoreductase-like protein
MADRLKLGLSIGYSGADMHLPIDQIRRAEDLGYDSVWTAEAYGSDALSPLAYIAAQTERIRLGTGVIQLAARTPANAAMTAGTIDALAGGDRMILGIGVSGPQIVEGWYGQPWGRPNRRIREYCDIIRAIWCRDEPVSYDGQEFQLPYHGEGTLGIGKPLRSILHMNPDIPIWLGTGTEANVKLTAEIADGWLPLGFVPGGMKTFQPWLDTGFERAGGGKSLKDLEIQVGVQVIITDEIGEAFRQMKPNVALYVGGMGHKNKNFHNDAMVRRGYPESAQAIQELYLEGRKGEAVEAVPDEFLDEQSLVGPVERIRERFKAWEDSGATGLTVRATQPEAIELMAELTGARASV